MPSLKSKFPTFHDWGSALLPEIYAPEKLAGALHLRATELASGVFMNDGRGRFTFHELPRVAQASAIFGLAVADFTGDGHPDIVAAQNFYGPQVETGRFDGGIGLLLAGDGKGQFKAVPAPESGIAVSGEARGVAMADWNQDGWPDLVMTRINQQASAFTLRAPAKARSFAVKLVGAKGNPDAFGAKVVVRFGNGAVRAAEIAGGSGYMSQSEPLAFFAYTPDSVPESIEVTWPDGKKTQHAFEPGKPRIILKQAI